jgi:hypothetical protein
VRRWIRPEKPPSLAELRFFGLTGIFISLWEVSMESLLVVASLLGSPDLAGNPQQNYSSVTPPQTKVAVICFGAGEQVSGMNKICYYDCLGSIVAINVKSYQLCPLSINR